MNSYDAIAQLAEVKALVLSDPMGALIEQTGKIDGETVGAVNAYCVQGLSTAGDILGLGQLVSLALVGGGTGHLVYLHGGVIVGVAFDPSRPQAALEKKVETLLQAVKP